MHFTKHIEKYADEISIKNLHKNDISRKIMQKASSCLLHRLYVSVLNTPAIN